MPDTSSLGDYGGASQRISVRFGDELLQDGFTVVPNRVLKHYAQLGISAAEMMWVLHVWEFWWYEQDPYPSLQLLAERMQVSRRQVRNYVASLREKGFLQVRERYSPDVGQTTSEYDFQPLLDAVRALAREHETRSVLPRKNLSEGGRKNPSGAPRNSASPEEDEHETDTERSISNTRRQSTLDRSSDSPPATRLNGTTGPATPIPKPLRARLPPVERRRYDADRRRIVDYLSDFARELGDAAPLASSVTRAVNLMHRAGVDLEAFTEALYHARAVTKERWAAVRKEERDPGRPFPRKQAMAYFFAELEHALGLRDLPETPAEHAARKEAEEQDRQRDRGRGRHPAWARATGPRDWVQTYKPDEGLPAMGANGDEDDGA